MPHIYLIIMTSDVVGLCIFFRSNNFITTYSIFVILCFYTTCAQVEATGVYLHGSIPFIN